MAGPSWLAGVFAAAMILTAGYAASRLATSRLLRVATEADTDGLHALMGTAMAGMFLPQLRLLPSSAWAVLFGTGAVWFATSALSARRTAGRRWQCRFPVPHLVECTAMVYMLLALPTAQRGPGMAMPGMGSSPGAAGGLPSACACPRPIYARLHPVDRRSAGRPGPGQDSANRHTPTPVPGR